MHHGQHAAADQLITLPLSKPRISPVSDGTASLVDTALAAQTRFRSVDQGTAWVDPAVSPRSRIEVPSKPSDEEAVFDRLVSLKVQASQLSMHLETAWRTGMFGQLDCLLDHDNWHLSDKLPRLDSFRTFLRAVVFNKLSRRPGLGVTAEGNIVAAWTKGKDRLTVECLAQDKLRYTVIKYVGEERVSAAGQAPARLLLRYLQPYEPEVWFG
ncbi:hypothetical protein ACQKLX_10070 [Bosea sp. NPDC003192]|uniref:hypothetical protein n=1 Tax=Bosea sp. NPDC003192 TaxID=3390551 RepID=UPI003D00185A